jgi:hypothetical protein
MDIKKGYKKASQLNLSANLLDKSLAVQHKEFSVFQL